MTATMKRRLERLEARVRPVQGPRVVRLWSGHYNEAGELVKDRMNARIPDIEHEDTFDIIITAPRIDPATGRAILAAEVKP